MNANYRRRPAWESDAESLRQAIVRAVTGNLAIRRRPRGCRESSLAEDSSSVTVLGRPGCRAPFG